jgi:general secretion pathway protein G
MRRFGTARKGVAGGTGEALAPARDAANNARALPDYNRPMPASPIATCRPRATATTKPRRARAGRASGFTLIEIMVVIVILGILAALVVPRVLERPDEARAVAAKSDIATVMQALKFYRLDNQRYPTTEQGLAALVTRPTQAPVPPNWKNNGYLERLPKDPWGHAYQYLSPGLRGEIDVFSLGADGQPGGTGIDADIGSWDL